MLTIEFGAIMKCDCANGLKVSDVFNIGIIDPDTVMCFFRFVGKVDLLS